MGRGRPSAGHGRRERARRPGVRWEYGKHGGAGRRGCSGELVQLCLLTGAPGSEAPTPLSRLGHRGAAFLDSDPKGRPRGSGKPFLGCKPGTRLGESHLRVMRGVREETTPRRGAEGESGLRHLSHDPSPRARPALRSGVWGPAVCPLVLCYSSIHSLIHPFSTERLSQQATFH